MSRVPLSVSVSELGFEFIFGSVGLQFVSFLVHFIFCFHTVLESLYVCVYCSDVHFLWFRNEVEVFA